MTVELSQLARAVASVLGLSPAHGFEGRWAQVFSLPKGGRIYFSAGRQKAQFHVTNNVADGLRDHQCTYRDGEAPKTTINVSASKSAEQIAADIQRRLLPAHRREVSLCTERNAQHDEYNARRVNALMKVARPFGCVVDCDPRTGEPRPLEVERQGEFRLTARSCADAIRLELEIIPELAGKIAKFLAARKVPR